MLAVVLTCLGKFVCMDHLGLRAEFVSVAVVGWGAYVFFRSRTTSGILAYWGFRWDTFPSVMRLLWPFALAAFGGCLAIGAWRHTLPSNWHIVPLLVTYPIWGTIQQFLCVGLVAGNLQDRPASRPKRLVIIGITALLFAIVHLPDKRLMAGTFVLALVYAAVYLRQRNLYALGILHGWLGALFYFTVLARDPFWEIFGKWLG